MLFNHNIDGIGSQFAGGMGGQFQMPPGFPPPLPGQYSSSIPGFPYSNPTGYPQGFDPYSLVRLLCSCLHSLIIVMTVRIDYAATAASPAATRSAPTSELELVCSHRVGANASIQTTSASKYGSAAAKPSLFYVSEAIKSHIYLAPAPPSNPVYDLKVTVCKLRVHSLYLVYY